MSDRSRDKKAGKPADERTARLKAALKANLSRRKAQMRARTTQPDEKNNTKKD